MKTKPNSNRTSRPSSVLSIDAMRLYPHPVAATAAAAGQQFLSTHNTHERTYPAYGLIDCAARHSSSATSRQKDSAADAPLCARCAVAAGGAASRASCKKRQAPEARTRQGLRGGSGINIR